MASRRLSIFRGVAVLVLGLGMVSAAALGQAPPRPMPDAAGPSTPAPWAEKKAEATPLSASAGTTEPVFDPNSPPRRSHPPADPVAAAAYAVLEKHCARCHQSGKLERPAPAAAFGNVLLLDELASAPHIVHPGNPDASRLYVMMLRRSMPAGVHNHSNGTDKPERAGPKPEEIAAVRSWIAALPPRQQCNERRLVTPADHAATLSQLIELTREDPAKLRFVSIAHLHNGCVRFEALAAYRQAIVRLFNSLSWKVAPVAVPPVDVARTLLKINLDDLGWQPEHWDRIMRSTTSGTDPLGLTPPLPANMREAFGTTIPVARADWFAETVLSAPLYYDVLGLPGTGPEILKMLQIDPARQNAPGDASQALVQPSRFAVQPSLVERRSSPTGAFWQAYHRLAREGDAGFATPVTAPLAEPVPHHASRGMFTLPNGLPAFFVLGESGSRLDVVPPNIASPAFVAEVKVRGGLDCLACHGAGPVQPARPGEPPGSQAHALLADREAARGALRRLGIDPDLTLHGVEPLVALAKEYSRPVNGERAAAELGVELKDLRKLADGGDGSTNTLARRLLQGLVARVEVDASARHLREALSRPGSEPVGVDGPKPAAEQVYAPIDRAPGLVLYSDKTSYRKGEPLQLFVRAGNDCHLTVVSIDTRGRGTAIFPNDFETNAFLTAGQELRLPGPDAPFAFRLNEAGRETIVALCSEAAGLTDGIRHDFEKQRFTELGDYAAFLLQNAWAQPAKTDASPLRPEPRPRSRRRAAPDVPVEQHARPDQISRTAITIVVDEARD